MLFILSDAGVPSVAAILRVTPGVSPPPPPPTITLSVTGRMDATRQYMTLSWSGASGPTVAVYRNGPFLTNTENDGKYTNSRNYTGTATYTYKVCLRGTTTCSNEATVRFGGGTPTNTPPVANFSFSCTGLACTFTDQSTDSDGSLTTWRWTFGDGGSSSVRSPGHTYPAPGTYTATLTVTDDDGATHARSVSVSVTTGSSITLSVSGWEDATKQYMALTWSGATGANVDVYRNGPFLTSTANDGKYTNSRSFTGPASYTYKVCLTGTTTCSNQASVTFP
jgi:PKD repeat protein